MIIFGTVITALAFTIFLIAACLPRRDRSRRSKEVALRLTTPADQRAARECGDTAQRITERRPLPASPVHLIGNEPDRSFLDMVEREHAANVAADIARMNALLDEPAAMTPTALEILERAVWGPSPLEEVVKHRLDESMGHDTSIDYGSTTYDAGPDPDPAPGFDGGSSDGGGSDGEW